MVERVQLGRLLVERGLLDAALLEVAIDEQQRTGASLGQVLVGMGAIREDELIAVLAQQVGAEFVDLTTTAVDADARAAIPEALAQDLHVVGVSWRGEALVVAMVDPSDATIIERVRQATGHDVIAVVATRTAIAAALAPADDAATRVSPASAPPATPADRRSRAVTAVLEQARRARATEVLVDTTADGARVRMRIDGVLHEARPLRPNEAAALRDAVPELAADPGCTVVTLPTRDGDAIAIRVRDDADGAATIADVGLDADRTAQARALLAGRHGAVVVTGPAGAGVTTTLHALLADATMADVHAVAIEDPIERTLSGVTQVVVPPDLALATVVRRAIDARPDVMLIGEVRDGATAALALDGALTGRLVLAGLMGRDAAAVPGRLLAMGLEPVVVSSALRGVVAPRLARRLCDSCKEPWTPSEAELAAVGWDDALDEMPALFRPVGCDACVGIGYRGVVVVAEILSMSDELARLVAARANASDIHKLAVTQGMQPLRRAGLGLARAGVTSLAEVARVT